MEAGRIVLTSEPFQLSDIFDSVSNVFRLALMSKGLEFSSTIAPDMPQRFIGDEARVRQILFNLVGNAIKFTRGGSVRLEGWSRPRAGQPGRANLYLSVSDTGIGIPDDKVDHVFQRFTQTDASYTRQYEGAGLGLAIVKRLMQTMGGDIAVDSTEGQGTAIYLHLPLAVAEERLEPATRGEAQAHDPDRPLRILMDIQMPGMNGVEATEQIRSDEKKSGGRPVWIIALTAYALAGDREKFLEAGMDDYVSKPVQEQALIEALRRASAVSAARGVARSVRS
jgi:CheY-like chemotaxis protein